MGNNPFGRKCVKVKLYYPFAKACANCKTFRFKISYFFCPGEYEAEQPRPPSAAWTDSSSGKTKLSQNNTSPHSSVPSGLNSAEVSRRSTNISVCSVACFMSSTNFGNIDFLRCLWMMILWQTHLHFCTTLLSLNTLC